MAFTSVLIYLYDKCAAEIIVKCNLDFALGSGNCLARGGPQASGGKVYEHTGPAGRGKLWWTLMMV